MPFAAHQWKELESYLPAGSLGFINSLLRSYRIKLVLTNPRRGMLGYYKPPKRGNKQHIITVNKDLNPYMLFFVLIHEIAHLQTYIAFARRAKPHGREWQACFKELLQTSLQVVDFPAIIQKTIEDRIRNPRSLRSCTDVKLMRILKQFDNPAVKAGRTFVEQIPIGGIFEDARGRRLRIIEKKRTRFLCREVRSDRLYYYPALLEVTPSKKA